MVYIPSYWWRCPGCNEDNTDRNKKCWRCQAPQPPKEPDA